MKKISKFALFILMMSATCLFAQTKTEKFVVLIGIDGVSAEAFQYSNAPIMRNLIARGAISLKTRGVMPTVSAPNWATILAGAGPEQHGVTSNSWSLQNFTIEPTAKDKDGFFPSIFTLLNQQKPNLKTGMFYDWDWLGTFVNKKYISKEKYTTGFKTVTPLAIDFIKTAKPAFTFIYYGHPDEVGHEMGFNTKAYYSAINEVDSEIGRIIETLKEAEMYEKTTLIIVSDHGGIDFGHGGESMIELETPFIISGPGIKKNVVLEKSNDLINIAPTIADILGLTPPHEWTGRSIQEAFMSKIQSPVSIKYVAKPSVSLASGSYIGTQQIEVTTTSPASEIYYSTDGSLPDKNSNKYKSPINISENTIFKAVAISDNQSSQVTRKDYVFVKTVKNAQLNSIPSDKYPGLGVLSLFDDLVGSSNFKNKQWMGFEGNDFDLSADLGEVKPISELGVYVLQLPASWIFLPQLVEFQVSDDGMNFRTIASIYPADIDDIRMDGPVLLARNFENVSAKYIKVKAINQGTCPPGHAGEGQKCWLMISEIEVN